MSDSDTYGALGQERLRVLLMRVANLPREQRFAVAQWANRIIVDTGLLENVLAGFIAIESIDADGHVQVSMTDAGRSALREADMLRNVGGEG